MSFSIGPFGIDAAERPFLYAVLLWIILVFAALSGLSRSFIKEEESGTMDLLRLSARPQAVFLGKLIFNITLIGALEILTVPLFIFLMKYRIESPFFFILMVITGGCGLAAGTTIVAAMMVQSGSRGALFSALSLPLILPLMITAIKGCERAAIGLGVDGFPELKIVISYIIIMVTLSVLLFPAVWEE